LPLTFRTSRFVNQVDIALNFLETNISSQKFPINALFTSAKLAGKNVCDFAKQSCRPICLVYLWRCDTNKTIQTVSLHPR
jgi:hypothetical protein